MVIVYLFEFPPSWAEYLHKVVKHFYVGSTFDSLVSNRAFIRICLQKPPHIVETIETHGYLDCVLYTYIISDVSMSFLRAGYDGARVGELYDELGHH